MAKQQSSLLGLPSLEGFSGSSSNGAIAPYASRQKLNRDLQRILDERDKQMFVIGSQALKSNFGQDKIDELTKICSTYLDKRLAAEGQI